VTTMVREVYAALKAAKVDEQLAVEAASAVGERRQLATKHDLALTAAELRQSVAELRAEMHAMKADISPWGAAALLAQAGAIVALVKPV